MDWYTFGLLLYENLPLYLAILGGSLLIYICIFRNVYLSFLDPLIFNLIYSVFGFSVVLFLYATDSIHVRYLFSYMFTQLAFFVGLFIFRPLNKGTLLNEETIKVSFIDERILLKTLFLLCSVGFIIAQLLSYKVVGIPLLMESRLGAYAGSGGWGILGRIIEVLRPATTFLLFYLLLMSERSFIWRLYINMFAIFLLLSFALSGSKSLFMSIGFILFICLLLNASELKSKFLSLRKYEASIIISGLMFAFFTIFMQTKAVSASGESSLNVFLYRLVASGDAYYFAYPNNNIESINGSDSFLALFGDIFSVLRIVPREDQPEVLGLQLFGMFSSADLLVGPNARHNIFGYVYYGFYGSIIFSFIIGLLLSFVRNRFFFLLKRNIIGQITFMFLYLNLTFIETDPPVAVWGMENVLLIFPPFIILSMVLHIPLRNFKLHKLKEN